MYAALYGMLGPQSLLCFDEPDNFVSLPEVQPWLQALRDLLEQRGGQAIVISHHPEVIDYLATDSAWRFERPAGVVVARKLDFAPFARIETLGDHCEGWLARHAPAPGCTLLCEDDEHERFFRPILERRFSRGQVHVEPIGRSAGPVSPLSFPPTPARVRACTSDIRRKPGDLWWLWMGT